MADDTRQHGNGEGLPPNPGFVGSDVNGDPGAAALLDLGSARTENRLLRLLPPEDAALLVSRFEPVDLTRGDVLIAAGEPVEAVVFPESGILSVIAVAADDRRTEVGILGREGFSAGSLLLGVDRSPHETIVQVAGRGNRIEARALLEIVENRPAVATLMRRFMHVFGVQTGHTALSNTGYTIEERLARWLLMCHDRMDGDDLALTHEFLALMLSVRRSGVTLATHLLAGSKVIANRRGTITVLDREALVGIAGSSYGAPEAEYERVLGPFRDR